MRRTRTLRLALALRGGVSLAVWMGGAVFEINELRRDLQKDEQVSYLGQFAKWLGYDAVEIDVLAGTSAGGLNSALLGVALANYDAPLGDLKDIWLKQAGLDKLLPTVRNTKRRSILDSDYFGEQIAKVIANIKQHGGAFAATPQDPPYLNVLIPVTVVDPYYISSRLDPAAPVEETRTRGVIHMRGEDLRLHDDVAVETVAKAAQATASFPFAFAPVEATQGVLSHLEVEGKRPGAAFLFDGGVTDNMPVGKAVRAIDDAPAEGTTKRVLLYFWPRQTRFEVSVAGAVAEPGPARVAKAIFASLGSKSLVADLDMLASENSAAAQRRDQRTQILEDLAAGSVRQGFGANAPPAPIQLDTREAARYATMEHGSAMARFLDLFLQPNEHLDAPPPPGPVNIDQTELRTAASGVPQTVDLRPWARVARTASLLIDWHRAVEDYPTNAGTLKDLGAKNALYQIRRLAYEGGSRLNVETLEAACDEASAVAARVRLARTEMSNATVELVKLAGWAAKLRQLAVVPSEADPFAVAMHTLIPTTNPAASKTLAKIDYELYPVHQGLAVVRTVTIGFKTLTGAAPTPFAANFKWPIGRTPAPEQELLVFRSVKPAKGATDAQAPNAVDPATKLAGSQFGSFGGFVDSEWRLNDWMWGRMDAAATLVRVLVENAAEVPADDAGHRAAFSQGEWTDLPAGYPDRVWENAEAKDGLQAVAMWRSQLDIVRELNADNSSFDLRAAIDKHDVKPRSLSGKWGTRTLGSTAMRASAHAWRMVSDDLGGIARRLARSMYPMIALLLNLFVARERTTAILGIFIAADVMPRLHSNAGARTTVVILLATFAIGWAMTTTGRRTSRVALAWHAASVLAVAAAAVSARFIGSDSLHALLPRVSERGWRPSALPAAGAALAVLSLLFWVRKRPRAVLAVVAGAVAGGWVWLADAAPTFDSRWLRHIAIFGSFWWAVIVIVWATYSLSYTVDIGERTGSG
jgi:predicted acylesterase/phospholipase RssA